MAYISRSVCVCVCLHARILNVLGISLSLSSWMWNIGTVVRKYNARIIGNMEWHGRLLLHWSQLRIFHLSNTKINKSN